MMYGHKAGTLVWLGITWMQETPPVKQYNWNSSSHIIIHPTEPPIRNRARKLKASLIVSVGLRIKIFHNLKGQVRVDKQQGSPQGSERMLLDKLFKDKAADLKKISRHYKINFTAVMTMFLLKYSTWTIQPHACQIVPISHLQIKSYFFWSKIHLNVTLHVKDVFMTRQGCFCNSSSMDLWKGDDTPVILQFLIEKQSLC